MALLPCRWYGSVAKVVRNGPDRRTSPLDAPSVSTETGCDQPKTPRAGEEMSTTIDINEVELEEFQSRVFADLAAGYGGVMIGLGAKLGLYAALAGAGP